MSANFKNIFIGFFILISYSSFSQTLKGIVLEKKADGKVEPVIGAVVRWKNSKLGTSADIEGKFNLSKTVDNRHLIISSVGFKTDTLIVQSEEFLTIHLQPESSTLQEVTVKSEATVIDRLNPIQTEIITTKALAKAACCNLSESFETNASVSVSYSDAVTGSKQIQLLGLSGNYVQTNSENIPNIRGLNTTFGLNYIPGTWISSIDVGKGAGSVVSGYESMTGQINIELQKPELADKLYLNTYLNSFGRGEVNLNLAKKINKKLSVGLLSHVSTLQNRIDRNGDNFLDIPLYNQYNVINRWKYQTDNYMVQFGIKGLYEDRLGGQNNFQPEQRGSSLVYGFGSQTKRIEFFSKTARFYQSKPYKGLGLILNGAVHDNQSFFGLRNYTGVQKTLYANLIYQNIFGNTNHQYKAGLSYLLDDYNETLSGINPRNRQESVPGAFFEYTYTLPEKLTIVAGGRVDIHNLYGTRFTPRLHAKYDISKDIHLRVSAGKGWRVANPLAENYGLLVSSRFVEFENTLRPEESWNYGISLSNEFHVFGNKTSLIIDAYRTDFQNQVIVDMESAGLLRFYNLQGRSYSNSFQAELNYVPAKRFDLKIAYRLFDVKNDFLQTDRSLLLKSKQFLNRDRVLFNIGYALPYDKWKFDLTWQWNGARRIPAMPQHIESYFKASATAPGYSNINAQITRTFLKWDVYLGGENLNNFTQANPIIASDDPFGRHFDAGMTWGPVIGRMVYIGMRYKIK
ncbi:TonB-dependent siderophore receptor [Emticicia sp. BO119]|uniref:TonB-dependent receptor plug domain-containing protein n=1 Tax=Emticicia sp. BO119 TaxID=2757768 RepID=UPI0015F07587|nr:TonB-dependent receptor [Emticicia sp. BO119]MBA4853434.1 TonB-dependent receptor [Emticicia sp. BO119]